MISGHPVWRSENDRLLHQQYILGRKSKIADGGGGRFTQRTGLAELWRFGQVKWGKAPLVAGDGGKKECGYMMVREEKRTGFYMLHRPDLLSRPKL